MLDEDDTERPLYIAACVYTYIVIPFWIFKKIYKSVEVAATLVTHTHTRKAEAAREKQRRGYILM